MPTKQKPSITGPHNGDFSYFVCNKSYSISRAKTLLKGRITFIINKIMKAPGIVMIEDTEVVHRT